MRLEVITHSTFVIFFQLVFLSCGEDDGDDGDNMLHFVNVPLRGIIDEGYSASIDIGTPPQTFSILVDTGSSNLAVAGSAEFVSKEFKPHKSSTFEWLHDRISVQYSQGFWQGELADDELKFTVTPNLPISAKFVVIDYSEYFFVNGSNWQGILGLGYQSIAEEGIEPFWETYIDEHNFEDIFSLGLCGLQSKSKIELQDSDEAQGVLTLGGADSSKFVGAMQYTPIVRTTYFEVVIMDMKVDGQSLGLDCKEYNFPRTIVDSGTTNLRLPRRVFDRVVAELAKDSVSSVVGHQRAFWEGNEVICWEPPEEKFDLFPSLSVSLMHSSSNESHPSYFEMTIVPEQYLSPVIFTDETLSEEAKCYRFSISASQDGTILGSTFMEGFYVKFDRSKKQIGFALSVCTKYASLNKPPTVGAVRTLDQSEVGDNFNPPFNLMECKFNMYEPNERPILVAAYVLISIACLCLLPLLVTFIHGQLLECGGYDDDDKDQLIE